MKLSKENLELIKTYMAKMPVSKAYLFGSYGRGDARESSDVDILVELDYTHPIGLMFIQMKLDLENLIQKDVDLVSAKGISKYIRPIIEREKLLIYAR